MKHYIGIKEVMAEPMHEALAVKKGYPRINTDGHVWRLGYHVQYENPDGSIYDFWSPMDVFENSYNLAETYIDRMVIEADELHARIKKLENFSDSEKFVSLTKHQQILICNQLSAMRNYFRYLNMRIDDIAKKHEMQ